MQLDLAKFPTTDKRVEFVNSSLSTFDQKSDKFVADRDKRAATSAQVREALAYDMKDIVRSLETARTSTNVKRAVDISIGQYMQEVYGFSRDANGSPDSFYHFMGINPSETTMQSLMTMPDFNEAYRWLGAEVIREAIRLGTRRAALYPNLIAAEQNVLNPQVVMPYIKMSDAMPTLVGEAETIPMGTVSFGQKTVKLRKIAGGMKITDEVRDYVPLNVLGLYMQDMGVKRNLALDVMAISTLINGESGNNNAAPVIGVNTVYSTPGTGLTYKDLLGIWITMGMLGKMPQSILSNKNMAMHYLTLPEFTNTLLRRPGNPDGVNVRTPIPTNSNFDIHGAMPVDNQVMLIDNTSALIKLNSQAMRVESERIVERQLDNIVVTETTGFAKMMVDSSVIIDQSVTIGSAPIPTWMNPLTTMTESFRGL